MENKQMLPVIKKGKALKNYDSHSIYEDTG